MYRPRSCRRAHRNRSKGGLLVWGGHSCPPLFSWFWVRGPGIAAESSSQRQRTGVSAPYERPGRASLGPFRCPRLPVYSLPVHLSVVLITHNEEFNLGRTLESVKPLVRNGQGEIIVVDSSSTDRTVDIAKSFGAKVFIE